MQAAEGKIAFICFHLFLRIETFQIVTDEKIKKFSSAAARVVSCGPALQEPQLLVFPPLPEEIPLAGMYSDNFRFCQADEVQDGGGHDRGLERRGGPFRRRRRPVEREAHARGMAEPDGRRRRRMERPF
jgi:hypothetical protein